jgi:hypothetical protein
LRSQPYAHAAAWAVFGVALLMVLRNELGVRSDLPFQWDELFFLTCTARDGVPGGMPWAGCHDNKGPLIYLVYALLLDSSDIYNLVRLKWAAFGVSVAILGMAAYLAYRVGGRMAALVCSALLASHWALSPSFLALKTEQPGMLLLLMGLAALPGLLGIKGHDRPLLAGVAFGLALLAKQAFLFPVMALGVVYCTMAAEHGAWQRLRRSLALGCGVLLPFLICWAYFWYAGRLDDHLASLILHVTMYVSPEPAGLLQRWSWRFGGLATVLASLLTFTLPLLVLIAAFIVRPRAIRPLAPRGLLTLVLGTLLIGLFTPMLMGAHLAPFAIAASVFLGAAVGRYLQSREPLDAELVVVVTLLLYGLVVVLTAWFGPAGRADTGRSFYRFEKLPAAATPYAYVAGIWPEFFVANNLKPASDVMYPTALPDAPNSWFFTQPNPATLKGRVAIDVFNANAEKLLRDFERTPPSYIHVSNEMARSPGQPRPSDIEVLSNYIDKRCSVFRLIEGNKQHAGVVYRCDH